MIEKTEIEQTANGASPSAAKLAIDPCVKPEEVKAISVTVIRDRMAQLEQDARQLMQTEQNLMMQLEQVREQRAGVAGAHQVLAGLVG